VQIPTCRSSRVVLAQNYINEFLVRISVDVAGEKKKANPGGHYPDETMRDPPFCIEQQRFFLPLYSAALNYAA